MSIVCSHNTNTFTRAQGSQLLLDFSQATERPCEQSYLPGILEFAKTLHNQGYLAHHLTCDSRRLVQHLDAKSATDEFVAALEDQLVREPAKAGFMKLK